MAFGHPVGASVARIPYSLALEMQKRYPIRYSKLIYRWWARNSILLENPSNREKMIYIHYLYK
ncbi:hypothetical protein [Lysinibacillus xylanilyticus]|uniref:hypothetical protein n=1 Tax=Lysinibacillus xylanilyticus TaxID=582475 RepID=UPI002B24F35A|nr:hypothetical protein [Lysinibacillus xylanilyticus]